MGCCARNSTEKLDRQTDVSGSGGYDLEQKWFYYLERRYDKDETDERRET